MCRAFRLMTAAMVFVVVAGGCRSGRLKRSYYDDWLEANAEAVQNLRKLAAEKNWKTVACGVDGVFVLDLAQAQCEAVYNTKNRIWVSSPVSHGRVALIESMSKRAGLNEREFTKHFLVIVDIKRRQEVARVAIEDKPGSFSEPQAILLREKDVIFPAGGRLDRYDLVAKRREVVLEERPFWDVASVQEVSEYLFVTRKMPHREGSELLVLDVRNAYALKARYEGVSKVVSAGRNVLVERNGEIHRFDPVGGPGERVTDGRLLGPLGEKGFMYSDARDAGQNGLLFVHYPEAREGKKVSEFEAREMAGRGTDPLVSSQADYVFVCREGAVVYPGVSHEYYWEAYEVASGSLVGAFYNPYLGKWYLLFLLGWTE